MQKTYPLEHAIHSLKKGIVLSLFILLSATAYSNPSDKNTTRITGCDFLAEKPTIPLPNSKGVPYSYDENREQGIGKIMVAGQTYTLTQEVPPPPCNQRLPPNTPNTLLVSVIAGANHLEIIADGTNCSRNATSDATWLIIKPGQTGTGSGRVEFTYEENTTNIPREGRITVAESVTFTVTQAPCSIILPLSSTTTPKPAAAGAGTIAVDVATTICAWAANSSTSSWITVLDPTGTGGGSVRYTYSENMETVARVGTVNVAGNIYTVHQEACSITLPVPPLARVAAAPAEGNIAVTAATNYCNWATRINTIPTTTTTPSTTPTRPWLSIVSGSMGAGSGNVLYFYEENTTMASRTGTITVAGITFTVEQAACAIRLPEIAGQVPVTGGPASLSVVVSAGSNNCEWTAVSNNPDWLIIPPGQITKGNKLLNYTVNTQNVTAIPRVGTITISGQTFTVTQAACSITLDSYTASKPATGGPGSIQVRAGVGNCSWTAVSSAIAVSNAPAWLTITSGLTGSGPGTVVYSVRENPTASPRTGTITIGDQIFTLTQATACALTLTSDTRSVEPTEGTGIIQVNAPPRNSTCTWAPERPSNSDWITITSGLTGMGSGTVGYRYTKNMETVQRTGTITVASRIFTLTQAAAPPCTFTLSSPSLPSLPLPSFIEVTAAALTAPATIVVTALRTNCVWTPSSQAWITLTSSQSVTGSGSVGYTYAENMETTAREGTITIGTATFTIKQAAAPPCTFGLPPESANVPVIGGNGTVQVSALRTNCTWTASPNVEWITIPAGSQNGTGPGPVEYRYSQNMGPEARTGTITIAGLLYTVNQAEPPCSFTLPVPAGNLPAAGGTSTLLATAIRNTCERNSSSNSLWITITPGQATGTGTGSVEYTYQENMETSQRTGSLTIGGRTYSVTQEAAPACTFTLASNSADVAAPTGEGSISVITPRRNCAWTASPNVEWITIPPGQSKTGSRSVNFTYTENVEISSRTGTITVAGQTYTVIQAAAPACTFPLTSSSAEVAVAAGKGALSFTALRPNCAWTASSNNADWLTVTSGQNGTGAGNVEYSYTENIVASIRTGTITVAGHTYTVTQAAAPVCTFKLSSSAADVSETAGTGSVSFTALRPNCAWTASSNVDWLTLTSQSGAGEGSVGYSYTENKASTSRTGILTIGGQTFTLIQNMVTGIEPTGHVRIFPNPAGDFVTIDLSAGHLKYASLKIVNQFGQSLYDMQNPHQTLQIPLKGFANGLYFVLLQGEEKLWVQKLVVRH